MLLVEDDPNDVLFFKRAVAKLEFPWDLDHAGDGEEAFRKLTGPDPPTHVVLDLKIPKKNGLELLQDLRERGLPTRVIILTSSNEKADQDTAARFGVDAYLLKPASNSEFLDLVGQIRRLWDSGVR
jgi:CheY-like chemotaxis protein